MASEWDNGPWLGDVAAWFDTTARTLPWRVEPRDPWSVLVSEVMLQQTPVSRVIPTYEAWLQRWPTPDHLAAEPAGEAVRMWGRLGYPRRALRLHAAAVTVVAQHAGRLPRSYEDLVALPGVGDYTASAVLAFAHKDRIPVLDTNVRRVIGRVQDGLALPASAAPTRGERADLAALLPDEPSAAAYASEALMELGALICTARAPSCDDCPVSHECAWLAAGRPDNQSPKGVQARFEGSDRQVRGRIMAVLRQAPGPVPQSAIDQVWSDDLQRARAQDSLRADGLIIVQDSMLTLP